MLASRSRCSSFHDAPRLEPGPSLAALWAPVDAAGMPCRTDRGQGLDLARGGIRVAARMAQEAEPGEQMRAQERRKASRVEDRDVDVRWARREGMGEVVVSERAAG